MVQLLIVICLSSFVLPTIPHQAHHLPKHMADTKVINKELNDTNIVHVLQTHHKTPKESIGDYPFSQLSSSRR